MKRLVHYFNSRFWRPFKQFLAERSLSFYLSVAALIVIAIFLVTASAFLVDLIYEKEMARLISKTNLALVFAFPIFLIVLILFMLGKTFLDRVTRKEGSLLRSRLIFSFLMVTIIPSLVLVMAFNKALSLSVEVFFRDSMVRAMDNSLAILKDNVKKSRLELGKEMNRIEELSAVVENGDQLILDAPKLKSQLKNSKLDYFYLHEVVNLRGVSKRLYLFAKKEENEKLRKLVDSLDFSNPVEQSYHIQEDVLIESRLLEGGRYVMTGAILMSSEPSTRVADTVDAIRRFKQFQILQQPLKASLLLIYLFFYVPILSLGVLYFYLRARQIAKPLGKLSEAAKNISQGDYSFRVEVRGDDEIRSLVDSFEKMAVELFYNRKKLNKMSQMEAWKKVAVRLAHELKNPLTPVQLAGEHIEKTIAKTDFETYSLLVDQFNLIQSEIKHIQNLVSEFSKFSQEIQLEKKPINRKEFLLRCYSLISVYEGVTFKTELESGSELRPLVDENRLWQVLVNLLQNAAESLLSSEQKEKTIILRSKTQIAENGLDWIIEIEDNGPGIAEEIREQIFQPYVTSKKTGTGLGLAICEEIVSAHEGHLDFESAPGATLFRIAIPIRLDVSQGGDI
jgi:nitrogen fixation/metabolism regulation signal transduction histidine kinase